MQPHTFYPPFSKIYCQIFSRKSLQSSNKIVLLTSSFKLRSGCLIGLNCKVLYASLSGRKQARWISSCKGILGFQSCWLAFSNMFKTVSSSQKSEINQTLNRVPCYYAWQFFMHNSANMKAIFMKPGQNVTFSKHKV